jgi:hypothetical protein
MAGIGAAGKNRLAIRPTLVWLARGFTWLMCIGSELDIEILNCMVVRRIRRLYAG